MKLHCSYFGCELIVKAKTLCSRHYQKQNGGHGQSKWQKKTLEKLRHIVITHYSEDNKNPFCSCCGENIYEFLTLDHINNDGATHKKSLSNNPISLHNDIINSGFPPVYDVLCHNCNWARGFLKKCPHKTRGKN